jgi:dephospho-CoA kinase
MFVIGLTGSFQTGKSTVAKMLARKGARGIDADQLARRVLQRGRPGYKKVVVVFGPAILKGKDIDRRKLAAIVFNNKEALGRLEKIVHPLVKKDIKKALQQYNAKGGMVVLDVPLLFEAGFDQLADQTIVVKANRRQQLQRAQQSLGMASRQAEQRIKAQWPLNKKIRLADIIIDNQGTKKETQKQVNNLWQKLQLKIRK